MRKDESPIRSQGADGVSTSLMNVGIRTLSKSCLPIDLVFHLTLWPLVWSSAIFFAFISWDMCSDETGWARALWVPAVVLLTPVTLWAVGQLILTPASSENVSLLPSGVKDSSAESTAQLEMSTRQSQTLI